MMKKLLFILLLVPIVSCSNDADGTNRTIDPIIGDWFCENCTPFYDDQYHTYVYYFNGLSLYTIHFDCEEKNLNLIQDSELLNCESEDIRGNWTNLGNDFNALIQSYNLKLGFQTDVETIADEELVKLRFTEDFNQFTFINNKGSITSYTRQ